ncbi:hypothetical protein Hanom_Chr11g01064721 [Helianthus anomalus]
MRSKTVRKIRSIVYTCLILHNMIIKDDGRAIAPVHIQDPPVEPVFMIQPIRSSLTKTRIGG